jgi:hypothetical protein
VTCGASVERKTQEIVQIGELGSLRHLPDQALTRDFGGADGI